MRAVLATSKKQSFSPGFCGERPARFPPGSETRPVLALIHTNYRRLLKSLHRAGEIVSADLRLPVLSVGWESFQPTCFLQAK